MNRDILNLLSQRYSYKMLRIFFKCCRYSDHILTISTTKLLSNLGSPIVESTSSSKPSMESRDCKASITSTKLLPNLASHVIELCRSFFAASNLLPDLRIEVVELSATSFYEKMKVQNIFEKNRSIINIQNFNVHAVFQISKQNLWT